MATVTKRTWRTSKGEPRSAWVLAYTDKAGERHREQYSLKRDADARRIEVEGDVSRGAYRSQAARKTVADACRAYWEHLEERRDRGERATTTYASTVRSELENYVIAIERPPEVAARHARAKPFTEGIPHVTLADLSSGQVVALRDRLRKAGVTVSTTRRVLASLSRAIDHAITLDWCAINPARSVSVIGTRADGPRKVVPPSKAVVKAAIEAAPADLAFAIKFAALTGLRASEQWALKWTGVDLSAATVTVSGRLDRHGKMGPPKSIAGARTVPLAAALVAELKVRGAGKVPSSYVFQNSRGGAVSHGNFLKRTLDPFLEATGLNFSWHALRHFAVSTWIEAGLEPKTIQALAGHATLAITMDRYGHLFPSDTQHAAMSAIASDLFGA